MDPLAKLTSLLRRSPLGEKTILEIDLDFSVLSAPPANPLEALRAINAPSMKALREGLREAAADEAVVGLIVHIGTCPLSPTQCDELGRAIAGFGEHKPVWAYTESFGEIGGALLPYVLASSAGQVWVQPSGQLGLGGIRAQVMLLRGSFDKLGLEPEFGQRHEFKTAANTYAAHEITPAHQEMTQQIANSLTHWAAATIAQQRHLSLEAVWEAFDAGPMDPDEAVRRGLVDRIGYRDEVYAAARAAWAAETAGLRYVHRHTGAPAAVEFLVGRSRPAIAVVEVRGGIVSGRPQRQGPTSQPVAAAEVVSQQLRAAGRDPHVKAVLLRIDSPGGSYIASDLIRREVLRLREQGRPVVACMGDVAASGGYFVAMPADEIVASPTTLTGSIGVLAGKFVTSGLKEKLGLVLEDVTSGAWASFLSSNQRFTEAHWSALNRRLDDIYADFTAKAAADRGLDLAVLEPLARGRVWTGVDAQERKLVDHLGGMDLAIERACALAGVDRRDATVRPVSLFGFLSQFRPAESSESLAAPSASVSARLDVDAVVALAAERLGLVVPGVLSLPWRIELDGGLAAPAFSG